MTISDELSDEERAIIVFLKQYFESAGMPNALWILNENENIADVRAILNGYREFYQKARNALSSLMARYLARSCPHCNGYVGIVMGVVTGVPIAWRGL